MNKDDLDRIKQHYLWIPWVKELATKIAEGGEQYLIDRAKKVNWTSNSPVLLRFGDENIDPFSFFYFLASKNTGKGFQTVFQSVHESFELTSTDITQFKEASIFPVPPSIAQLLFHDGVNFNPILLWKFFRQVTTSDPIVHADFSDVLSIKNVGVPKLTQVLFLINPDRFHPIDQSVEEKLGRDSVIRWKKQILEARYPAYKSAMVEINSRFPNCRPYEINIFSYLQGQGRKKGWPKLINHESRFFQISSNAFGKDENVNVWENPYEEEEVPSFSEGSCVYTGGPGSTGGNPYDDLPTPARGDIILVRNGVIQGQGIGVVLENEYVADSDHSNGWRKNKAIRVIWINKSTERIARLPGLPGFSTINHDHQIHKAFNEAYPSTFEMIKQLMSKPMSKDRNVPITPTPEDNEIDSKSDDRRTLNTILYGPPGTGKTYATFRRCVEICDGVSEGAEIEIRDRYQELLAAKHIEFVTFHQSYSYEEFVEGLRPDSAQDGGFSLKPDNGVLKRIAMRAANNSSEQFVLVIDEINRANISKVLGELVTLLEEDKRRHGTNEISVTLPYSRDSFTLPNNLHILGTMNTADRSIALLDTALRRRFVFEELPPKPEILADIGNKTGVDLPTVLEKINQRLEWFIDRDHQIGHAWFMGKELETKEEIDCIMRDKIIPLIAEYFYDDWKKVQSVLGGGDQFVCREILDRPPGDFEDTGDERFGWRIRKAFGDDAYDYLISGQSLTEENAPE